MARLIVEVARGPLRQRKVEIDPGARLRVGRVDRADLFVPHDDAMAAEHFELEWDGSVGRLRTLGAKGLVRTEVEGRPVDEAEVRHGGWIRAGNTVFSVHVEDEAPPRRGPGAVSGIAEAALASLRGEVAGGLYAVLDAARDDGILELVRQSVDPYRSLYDGAAAETLSSVAPYLVSIRQDSRLLDRLVLEGWRGRWGIYLTSTLPFDEVRRRLRRLVLVIDAATEQTLYFRFYDPRVLSTFLDVATPRQRDRVLSGLEAIFTEELDGTLRKHVVEARSR